jgi:hypothetical protein
MNKYDKLTGNYFGFEIFDETIREINNNSQKSEDGMFKLGIATAESAVRRLKEEFYIDITKMEEAVNAN